jgi:hypothetical protein
VTLARARLVALTSSAGLLIGVAAFAASASSPAVPCPTWTDPKGDTSAGGEPTGASADPDLDIVGTTFAPDAAGGLTVTVKVAGLTDVGPAFAPGDEFLVKLNIAGVASTVTLTRDTFFLGTETAKLKATASATGKVTFDVKTSTVTGVFTAAQVATAVGKPLRGLKLDTFSALSYGYTEAPVAAAGLGFPLYDTATAPATLTYTDAGGCGAGGGSVPEPTGTPQPSTEPSAEPTDEPTDTPEGSPVLAQPRAGCFAFKDAAGDAKPGSAPLTSPNNDADLDLTEISLKSTPDAVQVFSKVASLGTAPDTPVFDGHSFTAAFSVGGKAVSATAEKAGAATATPSTVKATAVFDTKASNVVFTFPKADLEKVAGAALTTLTGLTITSNATNPAGTFDGDTATGAKPEEKTYTYGDNTCFLPPVGSLALTAPTTAEYGDRVVVTGSLTDTAKEAVAGVKVHASVTGQPEQVAVTDDDGKVSFALPLTGKAGAKRVTLTFLGTEDVGPTSAGAALTETVEKTVLKAVAGKGSVTATLTDNDKSPVAGQLVAFTVGSKVTKVKTNAKGVAVLARQPAGTTVKVGFAAVTGYYSAAPTVSAKVL